MRIRTGAGQDDNGFSPNIVLVNVAGLGPNAASQTGRGQYDNREYTPL